MNLILIVSENMFQEHFHNFYISYENIFIVHENPGFNSTYIPHVPSTVDINTAILNKTLKYCSNVNQYLK